MKYDGTNFREVMEEHRRWIESGFGHIGSKADFRDAVFSPGTDFVGMNLSGVDFSFSCGVDIDFTGSNLSETNFNRSSFYRSSFKRVFIRKSYMPYCKFTDCDFSQSKLIESDFYNCCFTDCKFTDSEVSSLSCSFKDARLNNIIDPPHIPMNCPEEGSFIGWKKCVFTKNKPTIIGNYWMTTVCGIEPVIVKLLIPDEALRSSGTGFKCRCSKAIVLDIQKVDDPNVKYEYAYSGYDSRIRYYRGETVVPDEFDKDRFNVCSHGIHFFMDRQHAVDYIL